MYTSRHSLIFLALLSLFSHVIVAQTDLDSIYAVQVRKAVYLDKTIDTVSQPIVDWSNYPQTVQALCNRYRASGMPIHRSQFRHDYPLIFNQLGDSSFFAEALAYERIGIDFSEGEYVKLFASSFAGFQVLLKLLTPEIDRHNWQECLKILENYEEYFEDSNKERITELRELIEFGLNLELPAKTVIQTNKNTIDYDKYSPVITIDEREFYFCVDVHHQSERVFYMLKEDDRWKGARFQRIKGVGENTVPLYISADRNLLYLFDDGRVKIAERSSTQEDWQVVRDFEGITEEGQGKGGLAISNDQRVLIFSGRRLQRVGISTVENNDLYLSTLNSDGTWTLPINLGPVVNTQYAERSPYLHSDGKTLYFSSNGHVGFGGLDVFMTRRLDDTWLNWSMPQNLGIGVNGSGDDWGFIVSASGERAFLSSKGENSQVLFDVEVSSEHRPQPMKVLDMSVTNGAGNGIYADIEVRHIQSEEVILETETDSITGEFQIVLEKGKKYDITTQNSDYPETSRRLDLTDGKEQVEVFNIELKSFAELAAENISFPIDKLYFETKEAVIDSNSYASLRKIARTIIEKDFSIILEGHTDDVGSEKDNLDLSERRNFAVKSFLIQEGCSPNRIATKPFGESQPIGPNNTEEGRQKNRRVEIRIVQ